MSVETSALLTKEASDRADPFLLVDSALSSSKSPLIEITRFELFDLQILSRTASRTRWFHNSTHP